MYRVSGFLRILSIWLIVTTTQIIIFTSTTVATDSNSVVIPVIVIGGATLAFGLVAYLQDKELRNIEKKSEEFK